MSKPLDFECVCAEHGLQCECTPTNVLTSFVDGIRHYMNPPAWEELREWTLEKP